MLMFARDVMRQFDVCWIITGCRWILYFPSNCSRHLMCITAACMSMGVLVYIWIVQSACVISILLWKNVTYFSACWDRIHESLVRYVHIQDVMRTILKHSLQQQSHHDSAGFPSVTGCASVSSVLCTACLQEKDQVTGPLDDSAEQLKAVKRWCECQNALIVT